MPLSKTACASLLGGSDHSSDQEKPPGPGLTEPDPTHPDLNHRPTSSDVGSVLARHESVPDATSLASIDRPPGQEEKLPTAKIYHPLSLSVIALLMPASVFGTLARLGLQALVTYDGHSIFPLAWVQAGGCLVMGFALGFKEPLGRFYGPLYTALTTGFCGSFTTFSGWQVAVFQAWLDTGRFHRDWLRDVIDGLTQTVFTLAISLVSVQFGAHLASLIKPLVPTLPPPGRFVRHGLTALAVLIYAATYPAYFRLPASYRHQATAALLFSFPGTLTRYLLSIKLNPMLQLMPLGTFTANTFGTALLALFTVLQGTHGPPSPNACGVLRGLSDGYCGCLTTVSTFAAEVAALDNRKSWLYVVASWVTSQLLLLVILGPSYWAGHVSEQATCTYG
ncbi:CrcB-like protein-domain-containing protein [Amylocystis lapponica]|nr:CrcB-like protein-domain-containing protein [Amylocystis lapponica]